MHNSVHLSWAVSYIMSWASKIALKNTFQATTFKVEENSRIFQKLAQTFKDFFQGKMEFNDFP